MIQYTKRSFGQELKERVSLKQNVEEIAIWAHTAYLECPVETEPDLLKVMLDLNTMELGDQFAISYKMLNKIADDLIAGKIVDLNSNDYMDKSE